MWRSTLATSSPSSAPRMTTPSLSHSNSLAIVTPLSSWEAMVALARFPGLSWTFLSLVGDGGIGGDANPALRPARGGAWRQARRGRATGCQGQAAVLLPGAQPGSADEPRPTAHSCVWAGRITGSASEPERPALEAAQRHRPRAPGGSIRDRVGTPA